MELDRYDYTQLVEACICYNRIYEAVSYLSGNGLEGESVYKASGLLDVTRKLSVYEDTGEKDDDLRFLKFGSLLQDDRYDTEEKVGILLGEKEDPYKRADIKEKYRKPSYTAWEKFIMQLNGNIG